MSISVEELAREVNQAMPRRISEEKYYLGLDLGQAHDPSALAIVERLKIEGERSPLTFEREIKIEWNIRHLERFQLKTAYDTIVKLVGERVQLLRKAGKTSCELVVDATGVGRPCVDMLRRADLGIPIYPVTITAGNSVTSNDIGQGVPKRDLVSNLAVLVQGGRLKIAEGLPDSHILVKEFMTFRAKITTHGNDTFEAWRDGDHDDMVLAVALACWRAREKPTVGFVNVPGLVLS